MKTKKKPALKPLKVGEIFNLPCHATAKVTSVDRLLVCIELEDDAPSISTSEDGHPELRFLVKSIPQIIKILQRAQKTK